MYAKDLNEPKHEFLIRKCEDAKTKHFDDPNALLSVQILWMAFMRILMITTQAERGKF